MQPGTTIGPYVIRRHLGDGGMGSVWLADDTRLHRAVALKTLRAATSTDTAGRARLMREAQAAAALNHPHIATVYDVIEIDREVAIVFEYVAGVTLATALADGSWPIERVVDCAMQLTKALGAAHAQGIVHRDLKPSNVIVGADGNLKVLDFGIARLLPLGTTIGTGGDTSSGPGFMGTPAYAAPEQMLSTAVDERADLYSLGVILFELSTAKRPFAGHDAVALASAKLSTPAPPLSSVVAGVPPALDALVASLLQRDPGLRPSSAAEVLGALRAISGTPTTGALPPARQRSWRWVAAAVLLAAVIGAALLGLPFRRNATAPSDTQPVVAVMPLRNTSGDTSKEFLAAGLSENLIASLASSPSLIVLSRTAVMEALKTTAADSGKLMSELGASFIIDGSVQQSDNRLRVSINVVRPDRSIAWGGTFDGTIERVFDLQTRMALAVSEAMSAGQPTPAARPPTTNASAQEAYWRGRAFLDRWDVKGNIDAAIASFAAAIVADPNFALAHAGSGLAYWRKYAETLDQQFAKLAVDAGAKAAALEPDLPDVHHALAVSLAGTGQPDAAIRELNTAIAQRPTFDDARRQLAGILATSGKIDESIAEYDRAIALRPRFWNGYSSKGLALLNAARYQEAVTAFQQVIALQPDNYLGYQQLGSAYQFMGETAKAIEAYEKALAIRPTFGTYGNLGALLHVSGNYPKAVEAYQQAITLQPKIAGLHRNLGDAYLRMGRKDDAQRAYHMAIERAEADLNVNPTSARPMASLAVYLAKAGRIKDALARIAQARSLAPGDVQVQYRAAVVSSLTGRTEAALDDIAEVIQRGYSVRAVQEEEDFGGLRNNPRFIDLTRSNSPR